MRQDRRTRKKAKIAKAVTAIAVFVLLLAFILLFRVRKIKVYGNSHHSSEEISADLAGNAFLKNTVYMLWKYRDGKIPDDMPYLETLHVQMKSPSRLDVHVTEKTPVAYLDKEGYAYIDQDGMVLEITDQIYDGIPIVTGVPVEEPLLYQKLPAQSGAQLRTILSLTQLLSYQGVAADEIRFGENMEITIYTDYVEIQLGQDEYLEEKVANLAKILPRLEGQSGVLHLEGFTGRNEQVPFTPSDASIHATDEEDGGDAEGSEEGASDGAEEGGEGAEGGANSGGEDTREGAGSSGEDMQDGADSGEDGQAGNGDGQAGGDEQEDAGTTVYPMVFNSSGTLVYNVHVENGVVVDEYGSPVPGVTVNEDGNVVDAYMNVFDSTTGELVQQ